MPVLLFALLLALLTPLRSLAQADRSPVPAPTPAAAPVSQLLSPAEARAARLQIDIKLNALAARERSLKTAVPLALTITSGTLLAVSIGGVVWSSYVSMLNSDGHPEDVRKNDKIRMRAFGAALPISALALIASWAYLGKRAKERRAVRLESKRLRAERDQLELLVAPTIGRSSYGLSLSARF